MARDKLLLIDGVGLLRRPRRRALRRPARLGPRRHGTGFELDIITIVLLGGVSIFGGSGTMVGVALSILVMLNLRNGMGLGNIDRNTQTGVIGVLLILSVLVPNLFARIAGSWRVVERSPPEPTEGGDTPTQEPDLHPTQRDLWRRDMKRMRGLPRP